MSVYEVRGRISVEFLTAYIHPWSFSFISEVNISFRCQPCKRVNVAADGPEGDHLSVPDETGLCNIYPDIKRYVLRTYTITFYSADNVKVPS